MTTIFSTFKTFFVQQHLTSNFNYPTLMYRKLKQTGRLNGLTNS